MQVSSTGGNLNMYHASNAVFNMIQNLESQAKCVQYGECTIQSFCQNLKQKTLQQNMFKRIQNLESQAKSVKRARTCEISPPLHSAAIVDDHTW